MFIVFEGVDGAGKTTQLNKLVQWLEQSGHDIVSCNDPGSTALGEQLRAILLGAHETSIAMRTEMMLFTTARTQLVQEIIKPAIEAGKTVVLDRYIFSTIVYQGHAGDLETEDIRSVNHVATEGLMPDLTFVLDLPVEVSMKRLGDSLDRMESRGSEYFEKVRDGFILESERWPTGVELIDANRAPEEIQAEIQKTTEKYLQEFRD
jgi:dTMP kinase